MAAAQGTLPVKLREDGMGIQVAKREIGRTGIFARPMALGCYSMSSSYGARADDDSIKVIQAAIDSGIELIDTANQYGWGHNERLVGTAITGRRDAALLSSKFGTVRKEDGSLGVCGRPDHLRRECEASLGRLRTDRLDIYYQHRVDPDVPIEETVGAMAELVREGKVRFLGLCELSETTLRRACAVYPIAAVQMEYSLWTRNVEAKMASVFEELGVSLMAFSPLARGMLTGKLRSRDQLGPDDVRRKYPRFSAFSAGEYGRDVGEPGCSDDGGHRGAVRHWRGGRGPIPRGDDAASRERLRCNHERPEEIAKR